MWHLLLAAQPDPLTLPGYGLAGIVIAGLSTAYWRERKENTRLNKEAVERERYIGEKMLPIILRSAELYSATGPHIDRAHSQDDDLVETMRDVRDFMAEFNRRERRGR